MTRQAEFAKTAAWSCFPDTGIAALPASQMLDEVLVACANILGPKRAPFFANGVCSEAEEAGVPFETDAAVLECAAAARRRPGQ